MPRMCAFLARNGVERAHTTLENSERRDARPSVAGSVGSLSRTDRDVLGKFYGQATKGVRWMPWRQQAMKDVVSCEKPREAANRL